ncbi:MAG: hypothetical protein ACXWJH_00760 [Hyphomicrobium sp.]
MNAESFRDDAFPHDEPDEDSVVSRHPGQTAFYLVVSMLLAFFVVWGLEVVVRGHPTIEECAAVTDGNERLACYDKFSGRMPAQPAKGAIAPLAQ